jgi:hypothetical protein
VARLPAFGLAQWPSRHDQHGAVVPGTLADKVQRGRRREHRGGSGHQPNKAVAVGRRRGGGEGSFGGGTPAMGSSSGGGSDILEHREVNRGG